MLNTAKIQYRAALAAGLVLALLLLGACATGQSKPAVHTCEAETNAKDIINCYWGDIRSIILSEINTELRDYANDPRLDLRNINDDTSVEVDLLSDGRVKNVRVVNPSGSVLFDEIIRRSVQTAAPYDLPKNEQLRARLLHFVYRVGL